MVFYRHTSREADAIKKQQTRSLFTIRFSREKKKKGFSQSYSLSSKENSKLKSSNNPIIIIKKKNNTHTSSTQSDIRNHSANKAVPKQIILIFLQLSQDRICIQIEGKQHPTEH